MVETFSCDFLSCGNEVIYKLAREFRIKDSTSTLLIITITLDYKLKKCGPTVVENSISVKEWL